jgi:hypothetical protein
MPPAYSFGREKEEPGAITRAGGFAQVKLYQIEQCASWATPESRNLWLPSVAGL